MTLTIQNRVELNRVITAATTLSQSDTELPKHGHTHEYGSSDPIPQEIGGIPVNVMDVENGQGIIYNAANNMFLPGEAGASAGFAETPTGIINGVNKIFTLSETPSDMNSVIVVLDGVVQYNTIDFSVTGNVITFVEAPASGSSIFVFFAISVSLPDVTPVTVVSSSTYDVAINDRIVMVEYTATGSCTIIIPSALIASPGVTLRVYDAGDNASINNIVIETEGTETINKDLDGLTIDSNQVSVDLTMDGSNIFISGGTV